MAKAVKAGQAYVELGVKNSLDKGLKAASKQLKSFGASTARAGAAIAGVGGAVLTPLLGATAGFASAGDKLDKMSIRTGIAVESLSGLAFAAEQSGTSIDQLANAMFRANRRIGNAVTGTGPAVRALDELGLSAEALASMTPEEQLYALTDALAGVENQARRNQLGFEIFGDNFRQIQPLIAAGTEGIKELTDEAADLGRVMSGEDAKAAAAFTDAMNRVKSSITGVTLQIGAALAPVLERMANLVAGTVSGLVEFVRNNRQLVVTVAAAAAALVGIGSGLIAVGATISAIGVALGGLATAIALVLSPIGLVVAGLAGLAAAVYHYTDFAGQAIDWLDKRFGTLVDTVRDSIDAISAAFETGDFSKVWEITIDTMEMIFLDLTNGIRGYWDDAMNYLTAASTATAVGIGKVFEALGGALRTMLDGYKSYYNRVYNFVSEKIGEQTGVRTIGGPVDAFGSDFGGTEAAINSAASGLEQFGQNMQDAATARGEESRRARAAAAEERDARLKALRESLAAEGEAARGREKREKLEKLTGLEQPGDATASDSVATSKGVFSSAAAMFLGGSAGPAEQTARNTAKTAEATAEMADMMKTPGKAQARFV